MLRHQKIKPRSLSARQVEIEKSRLDTPRRVSDGGGLYLQISEYQTAAWVFRFQFMNRAHLMGLGSADKITLAQARKLAAEAREDLLRGINPLAARDWRRREAAERAKADELERERTFGAAVESWLVFKRQKWTNARYAGQVASQLKKHFGPIWHRPVRDVDLDAVLGVLRPLWTKYPVTAGRMRMHIEGILERATFHGWRDKNEPNPARWNGHLEHEFAAQKKSDVEHIPTIPLEDVQPYVADLRAQDGIVYRALETLLLTNVRTHDIRNMRWADVDFKRAEWRIPKFSKIGEPLTIPLSGRAMAILEGLPRMADNDHVFPGGRTAQSIGPNQLANAMKRLRPGLSPHSSRSSFKTWAS